MRTTAFLLIPTITFNTVAFAANKPLDPTAVRAKLEARGIGHGVRITLRDSSEVEGKIVSIGDASCVINSKTLSDPATIAYADVVGIHGHRVSKGKMVGIGVGVAAGALVVAAIVVTAGVVGSNKP